jgi:hypothetical protein
LPETIGGHESLPAGCWLSWVLWSPIRPCDKKSGNTLESRVFMRASNHRQHSRDSGAMCLLERQSSESDLAVVRKARPIINYPRKFVDGPAFSGK